MTLKGKILQHNYFHTMLITRITIHVDIVKTLVMYLTAANYSAASNTIFYQVVL